LVADDDDLVCRTVGRVLGTLGYDVTHVSNGAAAIDHLGRKPFDLVVSDWAMPLADGLAVLEAAARLQPGTPVIILTAEGGVQECVRAIRAGAFDFLSKPFAAEGLREVVTAARQPRGEAAAATSAPAAPRPLRPWSAASVVGSSPALARVLAVVQKVATTDTTVLITGETGTGKEVLARLIHGASRRCGHKLLAVNCGAFPEGLIESQLFGHVRGAFTGAGEARPGLLREADGGTVFLDEIGELPLALQTRLLRVLQERQVTPVGADRSQPIDVRIVAATNRDLEQMVAGGRFRQDLYFRLNVVSLAAPPLRERPEDIAELTDHFLAGLSQRLGRAFTVTDEARMALALYRWPGNVRELENALERATVLDRDGRVDVDDLPPALLAAEPPSADLAPAGDGEQGIDLAASVARYEWALIDRAMRQAGGNKSRAAALLGIGRTTLIDKLKRPRA
jgi:two-component system response regulator AtoC